MDSQHGSRRGLAHTRQLMLLARLTSGQGRPSCFHPLRSECSDKELATALSFRVEEVVHVQAFVE